MPAVAGIVQLRYLGEVAVGRVAEEPVAAQRVVGDLVAPVVVVAGDDEVEDPAWQYDGGGCDRVRGVIRERREQDATAPLSVTRFRVTVSKRPPETTIPCPAGQRGAAGQCRRVVDCRGRSCGGRSCRTGSRCRGRARPTCGDGASSLFCELVTMPVLLRSHSECSITRWPPELVPE